MTERKNADRREPIEVEHHPNLLDVVKIDGRWAQVVGGGNYVKYLYDATEAGVDWANLRLTKRWDAQVYSVRKSENFTPEELKNIHWASGEQEKYPHLKEEVRVYGEFKTITDD